MSLIRKRHYERLEKALFELEKNLLCSAPRTGRKEWCPREDFRRRADFRAVIERFWFEPFDVVGYSSAPSMDEKFWSGDADSRYAVILRLDRRLSTGLGFIRAGALLDKMYPREKP